MQSVKKNNVQEDGYSAGSVRHANFAASQTPALPGVGEALLSLLRHPVENLFRRWNWKSAVLSALTRGALFFFANLGAGISAALGAMSIESLFYVSVAGFYGAVTETFRKTRPAWLATLTIMVLMPTINHTLEFLLHWASGTKKLTASIIASVSFSMLSAVFNLFAMRRGAFIVGAGRQSLIDDFRQLPRIILDFLTAAPRALWQLWAKPQVDAD